MSQKMYNRVGLKLIAQLNIDMQFTNKMGTDFFNSQNIEYGEKSEALKEVLLDVQYIVSSVLKALPKKENDKVVDIKNDCQ